MDAVKEDFEEDFEEDFNEDLRREVSRHPILLNALLDTGKYEFKCRAYDLSLRGVRLRLDLPLQIGFECLLSIKGHPYIPAQVIWAKKSFIGWNLCPRPSGW